jgi:hypothetical protein
MTLQPSGGTPLLSRLARAFKGAIGLGASIGTGTDTDGVPFDERGRLLIDAGALADDTTRQAAVEAVAGCMLDDVVGLVTRLLTAAGYAHVETHREDDAMGAVVLLDRDETALDRQRLAVVVRMATPGSWFTPEDVLDALRLCAVRPADRVAEHVAIAGPTGLPADVEAEAEARHVATIDAEALVDLAVEHDAVDVLADHVPGLAHTPRPRSVE